jgi:hypothetical protein
MSRNVELTGGSSGGFVLPFKLPAFVLFVSFVVRIGITTAPEAI